MHDHGAIPPILVVCPWWLLPCHQRLTKVPCWQLLLLPAHLSHQIQAPRAAGSPARLESSVLVVAFSFGCRAKMSGGLSAMETSLAGEQVEIHHHQGLAGWHRPQLLLCPQCLAPGRNCRRILGWEHGGLQSKHCSKPCQPQSQSRMLRATLSISQPGDATIQGTIPGLHLSRWSHWSQTVPKTHHHSEQGDSLPLPNIHAQHGFPLFQGWKSLRAGTCTAGTTRARSPFQGSGWSWLAPGIQASTLRWS